MRLWNKLRNRLRRGRSGPVKVDVRQQLKHKVPDATDRQLDILQWVHPYTMTSPERILAVCNAVEYVVRSGVEGSFVECGVWRGGSTAAAALTLKQLGESDRELWLYDTFEGMSEPSKQDVDCWGYDAEQLLTEQDPDDAESVWCVSALQEVKDVILETGYPQERTRFIVGKVEETLPTQRPEKIALLRLDTDWYESTRCEMEELFPRLQPGGVLIIDDYGHWKGCRKAVDEYIANNSINIFLNRIDYTGRLGIKMSESLKDGNLKSLSHVA
ncbi:TylF/MycF family methyltransferase [bacterium]|nr:TylF/MycF family methyltransferase [bacterium]